MRLDDVRVLDLTRLAPGPYGTQLLADMGAEVVKIEDPEGGDYSRTMAPLTDDDIGVGFAALNRGKKSVTVNLKRDRGRKLFYELVADADVVFEQFRPGVADRLGVGYEDVREHNPEVVYCSLSGYGQDGPYSQRVGHDLNYIGFAGLLDMTREDDHHAPVIPGFPIADMAGGVFAALSITGALLSRELGNDSGERYIDISMTDTVLSFSQGLSARAAAGHDPRPGETLLTGAYPCYDVYETSDGRYVTLAALEPKFWRNFCEAIDRPELVEEHMADDPAVREAVREEIEVVFATRTRAEWENELGDADVMFGLVKTPTEALSDPQIAARDLIVGEEYAPRVGFPAKVAGGLDVGGQSAPELGEHTEQFLLAQGFDAEAIASLRDADVI